MPLLNNVTAYSHKIFVKLISYFAATLDTHFLHHILTVALNSNMSTDLLQTKACLLHLLNSFKISREGVKEMPLLTVSLS